MPQRKESAVSEVRSKEIVEHAYNAGVSTLMAMRAFVPKLPANSRAMKEFRNAQRELLLTARAIIDSQLGFLEHVEKITKGGEKKEELKKVQVKQKKE